MRIPQFLLPTFYLPPSYLGHSDAGASGLSILSPASVASGETFNFGSQYTNVLVSKQLLLMNTGSTDITITSISVSGIGFQVSPVGNTNNLVIDPNSYADITVTGQFSRSGIKTGVITVQSDDPSTPYIINLIADVTEHTDNLSDLTTQFGGSTIKARQVSKDVRRFSMVLSENNYRLHPQGIKFGGQQMALYKITSNQYALGVYVIDNTSNAFNPNDFSRNVQRNASIRGRRFEIRQDSKSRDVIAVNEDSGSSVADSFGLYGYEIATNANGSIICKRISGRISGYKKVFFGGTKVTAVKIGNLWYLAVLPV